MKKETNKKKRKLTKIERLYTVLDLLLDNVKKPENERDPNIVLKARKILYGDISESIH